MSDAPVERRVNRNEESRYDLGLLFTDGMPDLDDTAGYRGAIAARAAGISLSLIHI